MKQFLEPYKDYQLLLLGLCLMVAVVLSALVLTNGILEFKRLSSETVSVTGSASKMIQADHAVWEPVVAYRGDTQADAYNGLAQDVKTVTQYLIKQGVQPQELSLGTPTREVIYQKLDNGNTTNTVEGYTFSQTVHIETTDVPKITRLATDAMELVNQGINFESTDPEYLFDKLDSLKVQMLGLATENAKQRAQAMAKSTGNHIGHMRSSQMGVFQITAKNSTDVEDYGINDTTTPDKKVTAVVNVTFSLN